MPRAANAVGGEFGLVDNFWRGKIKSHCPAGSHAFVVQKVFHDDLHIDVSVFVFLAGLFAERAIFFFMTTGLIGVGVFRLCIAFHFDLGPVFPTVTPGIHANFGVDVLVFINGDQGFVDLKCEPKLCALTTDSSPGFRIGSDDFDVGAADNLRIVQIVIVLWNTTPHFGAAGPALGTIVLGGTLNEGLVGQGIIKGAACDQTQSNQVAQQKVF